MGSERGQAYELQGGARKLTPVAEVGAGVEEDVGAGVEEDGTIDLRVRHGRRMTEAVRAEKDGGTGGGARRPRRRRRTAARFGSLAVASFILREK